MPSVKLKDNWIDEDSQCLNCENAYLEKICLVWMCRAEECPYEKEGKTDG